MICTYCGESADTWDHVPPRVVRYALQQVPHSHISFVEVPACRECNTILGSDGPWTIGLRRQWVKSKLRKRYQSVLDTPTWTEEEISELGFTLQTSIRRMLVQREQIKLRLQYRGLITEDPIPSSPWVVKRHRRIKVRRIKVPLSKIKVPVHPLEPSRVKALRAFLLRPGTAFKAAARATLRQLEARLRANP